MFIYVLAIWRPDGAVLPDREPSDQLLQTEPVDHALKMIKKDHDWILDLTGNGRILLYALF